MGKHNFAFLILLVALLLSVFRLDSLPGFHGDEAWVVHQVFDKWSHGIFSWRGMNDYTGSLFLAISTPFLKLFGYSITVTRLLSVLLNFLFLIFVFLSAKMVTKKTEPAAWICALTAASPAFLISNRHAIEIIALGPLLHIVGIYFLLRRLFKTSANLYSIDETLSGFFFALAAYNHGSGIYLPLCLFFVVAVLYRKRALQFWKAPLSFAVLFAALSALRGFKKLQGSLVDRYLQPLIDPNRWLGLKDFVSEVLANIDGRAQSMRFLGHESGSWIAILFALFYLLILVFGIRHFNRKNILPLLVLVFSFLFIGLTAPSYSMNYFHHLILLIPLSLFNFLSYHPRSVLLFRTLSFMFLGGYCFNYLIPYFTNGHQMKIFYVGDRLVETSNHFVQTETLYNQLREKGIHTIIAEPHISWVLSVRSFGDEGLPYFKTQDAHFKEETYKRSYAKGTAFVTYAFPSNYRRGLKEPDQTEKFSTVNGYFQRADGYDPNFFVWEFSAIP